MAKSSHALASANIKRELAKKFPGVKFSVRSKSFSMGDSVDVRWELGPTRKQVEAIIDKYQDGDFDGMTDSYNYRSRGDKFRAANGSAKYVHASRSIPEDLYNHICRDIAAHWGVEYVSNWQRRDNDSYDLGSYANQALARCSFPVGAEYVGVESGDEITLTGACASGDAIKIVHSQTDWVEDARAVVKREFDYLKSKEQQPQRLRLVV